MQFQCLFQHLGKANFTYNEAPTPKDIFFSSRSWDKIAEGLYYVMSLEKGAY